MFYQFQYQYDEQKAVQAIQKLNWAIKSYNVNIKQLFDSVDQDQNRKLDFNDFSQLILRMDPSLTQFEIELIFQKFDKDRSRYITLHEFRTTLNQQNKNQPNFSQVNIANAEQAIQKLKYAIQYYNINVMELFAQYKKNYQNQLKKDDFQFLLLKIDPQLSKDDIDTAFVIFDADGSKSISFKEFTDILSQIGTGQFHYQPKQQPFPQQYPQQNMPQQQPQFQNNMNFPQQFPQQQQQFPQQQQQFAQKQFPQQGQQFPQQGQQFPQQGQQFPQQGQQFPQQFPQQGQQFPQQGQQFPQQFPQQGQQFPQQGQQFPQQGQQFPQQGQQFPQQGQQFPQQGQQFPQQQQYPQQMNYQQFQPQFK